MPFAVRLIACYPIICCGTPRAAFGDPIGCFISGAWSLSDHPMQKTYPMPPVMLFVGAGLPRRFTPQTMEGELFANREAGPAQELRHLRDVAQRYGVRLRE
jgi:hypothetical protein